MLEGVIQAPQDSVLVSEPGSLTLEFTRLSQITGDPRYYDAVQRIMDVFDEQQDTTEISGTL
jgi:mannosyl-oligosaccharide alpha-1,2-mannosidase